MTTNHTITMAIEPGGGASIWSRNIGRTFKVWHCQAYRIDDGPIQHIRTRVMLELFDKEERELVATGLDEELVLRGTGTVLTSNPTYDPIFGMTDSGGDLLLERDLAPAHDAELKAVATEFRRPRSVTNALGTFDFDPRLTWYRGKAKWGRRRFDLSIRADPEDAAQALLDQYTQALTDGTLGVAALRRFAVDDLLTTARGWRRLPLTRRGFAKSLKLEGLSVSGDHYELYFEDRRNIFLGHQIEVRGSLTGGPLEAGIVG